MTKRCKHCRTRITWMDYLFNKECIPCYEEVERRKDKKREINIEKQERDSKRYWDKQKEK